MDELDSQSGAWRRPDPVTGRRLTEQQEVPGGGLHPGPPDRTGPQDPVWSGPSSPITSAPRGPSITSPAGRHWNSAPRGPTLQQSPPLAGTGTAPPTG
ncbi:unnamed protein product [Gadus morhua 'NCC']